MGWQYVVNYLRQRSNYDRFSLKKYSAETYGQVTDTKIVIVFRLLACNRFSLKKSSCLPNRATKKQNGARFRVNPCLWPANLADLPGATLPKPLQKSRDGLYALSADLFRERDIAVSLGGLPSASVRCHHGAGAGPEGIAVAASPWGQPAVPVLRSLQAGGDDVGRRRVVHAVSDPSGGLRVGQP